MASPLATAFVRIRGEDGGLAADITRMAEPAADAGGRQAGARFADRFRETFRSSAGQLTEAGRTAGTRVEEGMASRLRAGQGDFARAGREAGDSFGEGFSRDVNGKLRDGRGRFAAEGRRSGSGFLSAFRTASGTGSGSGGSGGLLGGVLGSVRGLAGPMAVAVGALGIGKIASDAVHTEAEFSKTMRTMAAVAGVPAPQIKQLSDLALKMGADTSFSANEAADAMLELAKAGISPADIQAGALAGTLTLAAAAGTDLGTASTIAANAMSAFNLQGKDMQSIAAALAGGANASTASVTSLGEGLAQVGPGARNAGLSLNDTIGVLGAFDQAGIKGSDAGTSLKTMLVALVPQTAQATTAMKDLGLKFTDATGKFLPITEVAQQLKDKLSGLSQEAKTTALSKIFGSDASRAASVLANLGNKGLDPFIKATKDAGAAQSAAQAAMGGTSGALERLSGSFETAKLRLGQFLAPAVIAGADLLGRALNTVSPAINKIEGAIQLLGSGNFTADIGKSLGVSEDSPVVGELLAVRDAVTKVYAAAQLLATGNFTGGIGKSLGVSEDSHLVADLLKVRDTVSNVIGGIRVLLTGGNAANLADALGLNRTNEVVSDLITIRDNFGRAIGDIRRILGQVDGAVEASFGPIAPYIHQALGSAEEITGNLLGIIAETTRRELQVAEALWRIFGPSIIAYIGPALRAIVTIIAGSMQVIAGITRTILALLRGDWSGAAAGIREIVSGLTKVVLGLWRQSMALVQLVVRLAIAAVVAYFGGMASDIRSRVGRAVDEVKGFGSRVQSAVSGFGSLLVDAGRRLIDGLISGVDDRVGSLLSKVSSIAGQIRDYFPFSPAKRGPLRSSPMDRAGQNIVSQLAAGLGRTGPLDAAVSGIADKVSAGAGLQQASQVGTARRDAEDRHAALAAAGGRLHPDDIRLLAAALGASVGAAVGKALAPSRKPRAGLDDLADDLDRRLGFRFG